MNNWRLTAAKAVVACEKGGYSQLVIDSVLNSHMLDDRESKQASALFYGVMERRETLLRILSVYTKKKIDTEIKALLLIGLYQLLYMESIPERAALNETVSLCRTFKKTSATGFVNGILRAFLRDGKKLPQPKDDIDKLVIDYSCSRAVAKAFVSWMGMENAEKALKNSLGRPPVFLRVNTLKTDAKRLTETLLEEGINANNTDVLNCLEASGNIAHTKAFQQGLFTIEDKMCQKAAMALLAKSGERVLDLCSAPGSKTFLIAEEMKNNGEIIACDLSSGRLNLVSDGAKRLGIKIIKTSVNDGAELNDNFILKKFNRVLCDVPCSGLGVIRRKPELKYRNQEDFDEIHLLQYDILNNASKYLLKGGVLIYSTCTVNPLENEKNVLRFLDKNPEFAPMPFENGEFMIKNNIGENGADGFFIARMEKK